MKDIDVVRLWSLNYRLLVSVIASVADGINALGLEAKELFLLAAVDEHPFPAELAETLFMPKPTVTVYVKRLEAAGMVKRQIDTADLRRYRLTTTAAGKRAVTKGLALLSEAFGARLAKLTAAQQAQLQTLLELMSDA